MPHGCRHGCPSGSVAVRSRGSRRSCARRPNGRCPGRIRGMHPGGRQQARCRVSTAGGGTCRSRSHGRRTAAWAVTRSAADRLGHPGRGIRAGPKLPRRLLEHPGPGHVIAVPRSRQVRSLAGAWRIDRLVDETPADAWQPLFCGNRAKGLRVYDRAAAKLPADIAFGPDHRQRTGGRGVFPGREERVRPKRVQGPPPHRLVPAHHPGRTRPRRPGRTRRPGRRRTRKEGCRPDRIRPIAARTDRRST